MANTDERSLYLTEAGILMVLGLLAIAVPGFFTLSLELLCGAALMISGCYQIYLLLNKLRAPDGLRWLKAIFNTALGAILLFNPVAGVLTLTLLLIVYFIVSGSLQLFWSWQMHLNSSWPWLAVSGVLSLLMGAILISDWPVSAIWSLGLLFGINLLFSGMALWALAWPMPISRPEKH